MSLEVSHRLVGRKLCLRYKLMAPIDILKLPPPSRCNRQDGLWCHTCFEAFLAHPDGYLEVNASPSSQWAVYAFSGYRAGMRDQASTTPAVRLTRTPASLTLDANFEIPEGLVIGKIGLAAVIEERDGRRSYWALRHPPGAPDFHHPDCFALELSPSQGE